MARTKNTDPGKEMSFLDHLEELRWHLIRSTIAVVLAGTAAFLFKELIFEGIIFAPKRADFPTYQILCKAARFIGFEESFCFTELPFRVQSRTMAGQFSAHIWTSITAGFIVAFPYVLYEFWRFISPGLRTNERKSSRGFIIVASLLFFIGVLFGYYVITPLSMNFLGSYQVSEQVFNDFDLSSYIGLVRACALSAGLIFELPIIIYFLTKIGVVTPQFLKKYRKFALVIVLIISAIITPPDIASQVIVAVPVVILYEISIIIAKVVVRNQKRKLKAHGKPS
ncbi:MAG TPA: twin-arginine translocase subunit TatC [Flavobacteriaceae bacterium]|jgi:sec-independent protein translocase protein TatC|nr:twin-arginine translocase subunit TatC [Flavobacteriaceae bacterium]MAY52865.1 twin-arginine translocase subunit TatC [Flavobacteriaceae bacterium]HBR55436.1 twin-arginine translocase subunit TatC [Flavobacteriaceae bacterium]HIB49086.1 twin-arginine translocase subunit TatC [Flavobacteriaceae bacterium]HIN99725.1 twin-arginine translocase subunit TatC [Flavobacteriaceae bacterium]|tara:strand:- start:177 stop:1022 length:846 start_codon:yes stop_codon:yes gene_type:complete